MTEEGRRLEHVVRRKLLLDGASGCFAGIALGAQASKLVRNGCLGTEVGEAPPEELDWPVSCSGDPWALTQLVAESLASRGMVDPHDLALRSINLAKRGGGYGPRTAALKEVARYFETFALEGRSPLAQSPRANDSDPSGVLIKVSPISLLMAQLCLLRFPGPTNCEWLVGDQVRALGRITHPDKDIRPATLIAIQLSNALRFGQLAPKPHSGRDLLDYVRTPTLSGFLDVAFVERVFKTGAESDRLLSSFDELTKVVGPPITSAQMAVYALAISIRHATNLQDAFNEALTVEGADMVALLSLVGALVGANVGYAAIPETWKGVVLDARTAPTVAEEFIGTFDPPSTAA